MVVEVGTKKFNETDHKARDWATGRVVNISVSQASWLAVAGEKWPGKWCLYNGEVVEVSSVKSVNKLPEGESQTGLIKQNQWQQQQHQQQSSADEPTHVRRPQQQIAHGPAWQVTAQPHGMRTMTVGADGNVTVKFADRPVPVSQR